MMNYNNKNGKKYQINEVDSETMTLSGKSKKKKENLMIKPIPKFMFYVLFIIFIIAFLGLIALKLKFYYVNKNYNQYATETNYYKKKASDFHKIQKMNDINFIKSFHLSSINETDIQKYFEYIDKAKSGIYLHPKNLVEIENPKVSIIISIYNREDYVKSTIRSIQNQNLKEIEIIYINDNSTDNSSQYIKEEQKKDPRIVLYENKQNMGALYSKSIGVLLAKGEYVYSLDSDDMFCSEDYLNILYTTAKTGNYKFVRARALYINFNAKKISKKKPNWMVLWAKLINTEYYRDAVYSVGYNTLINKVSLLDDDLISIFMINRGNNILIEEVGVSHFIHPGSHVFNSRFSSRNNTREYCLNLVNTIKSFYKVTNYGIGKHYGDFLLKSHFYGGICCHMKKVEIVKELLDNYKREKEIEKEKKLQREKEKE